MRINFERLNLEHECYYDCITGKGFIIDEMPFSDLDKKVRNEGGPRSPRFGTTYGDANEFMDRYHCTCGALTGAAFEGEECPHCHTRVKFTELDIKYTGWISFGPYKVINPLYYHRLASALSKKNLEAIISNENIITSNGVIRKRTDPIEVKGVALKYLYLGLPEFYEAYEEVMEHFKKQRKQKADLIDELIEEKAKVFTSKYPVYSTALRSHNISAESYFYSPLKCLVA